MAEKKERKRKATILWYSQTGQSHACAVSAKEGLEHAGMEARLVALQKAKPGDLEVDLLVFAFPVFVFRPPNAVRGFVAGMPRLSARPKVLAIITYSGWPANTGWLFARMLEQRGLALDDYLGVRCRDSYIPFVKVLPFMNDATRPDSGSLARVARFATEAVHGTRKPKKPFFNPLDPAHWAGALTDERAARLFLGRREHEPNLCTQCGWCATLCPTGAITAC
ncbi:MAG: 4Fe-4S binding protein [Desulfatibacillaceae bacterium]